MSFLELARAARENGDYQAMIEVVPYARRIGMHSISMGNEVVFVLPEKEENIGNPTLPARHGGVIGGFMECAAQIFVAGSIEISDTQGGELFPRLFAPRSLSRHLCQL